MKLAEDIITNNITIPSVTKILQIAYLPVEGKQELNADLKAKSYPFIIQNFNQVNLDDIRFYHPQIAIDLLSYLQDSAKAGRFVVEASEGGKHHHHHNNNNNNNNNSSDNIINEDNHKKKSMSSSNAKKGVPPPPPRRGDSNLPSINLNASQNSDSSISEEEITPKDQGKGSSHSTVTRKKSTKEDGKEERKEKKKEERKEKKKKDEDKRKKKEK